MVENTSWPGWETVGLIGRGSFGEVYKIQREVLGDVAEAALKVISIPQNTADIDEMYNDGYDDESITSTFQSHLKSIVGEYSLMRKMNGSSNIVNCDDIRYTPHADGMGWDIFIKMELLTPLAKSLPADIPEDTVINVAKDMCAALELCKKHGIIHRDIKPQNIFVSPNGDYKLGDFGIAKTVEKTMGGTKIGTYKYMAPEVYNNQPYGTAADIYSLGLVLYWMLNERRMPFLPLPPEKLKAGMEEEARNRRLAGEPLPPPAHGSQKLKQIVLKACAPEVENRYQSAEALLRDLKKLSIGIVIPTGDSETAGDNIVTPDQNGEEHGAQDDPVPDPGPVITDDVPVPDEGGQKGKEETPPPPPPPLQPKPPKKHAGCFSPSQISSGKLWRRIGALVSIVILYIPIAEMFISRVITASIRLLSDNENLRDGSFRMVYDFFINLIGAETSIYGAVTDRFGIMLNPGAGMNMDVWYLLIPSLLMLVFPPVLFVIYLKSLLAGRTENSSETARKYGWRKVIRYSVAVSMYFLTAETLICRWISGNYAAMRLCEKLQKPIGGINNLLLKMVNANELIPYFPEDRFGVFLRPRSSCSWFDGLYLIVPSMVLLIGPIVYCAYRLILIRKREKNKKV